jgi:phage tail sheath gpL-like
MNSAMTAYPTVVIDLVTDPVIGLGVCIAETDRVDPMDPVATLTISDPDEAKVEMEMSDPDRVLVLYGLISPVTVNMNDYPELH